MYNTGCTHPHYHNDECIRFYDAINIEKRQKAIYDNSTFPLLPPSESIALPANIRPNISIKVLNKQVNKKKL
jgi:hypothetical protein